MKQTFIARALRVCALAMLGVAAAGHPECINTGNPAQLPAVVP